jgi:hypothetical protein
MPEVKKPVKKARGGLIYAAEGTLVPSPPKLPVNRYANGGMVNMSEGNKIPSEVWARGTKYTNVMSPEDFEKREVIRPKLSDDSAYDTPKVFKDYHEAHQKPISIDPALLDKQSSFSKYLQSGGRRMSNNVEIAPKLTTDEVLQYFQNRHFSLSSPYPDFFIIIQS